MSTRIVESLLSDARARFVFVGDPTTDATLMTLFVSALETVD